MTFSIKLSICKYKLTLIVFLRSYHMTSKSGNYIPAIQKVLFFKIWERVINLLVAFKGPWQTDLWCNFLSFSGIQNKSSKMLISWWSHRMIFHKMYILGQSVFVYYDRNINTRALLYYIGLQNTLEIMPKMAENTF